MDQDASPNLLAFLKSLCRYYSDFLETDFHAKTPSRQLLLRTKQGYRSAIDLSEFPAFRTAIFRALARRFDGVGVPSVSTGPSDATTATTGADEKSSLYQAIFELYKNLQVMDKYSAYLYLCPITYDGRQYPLFFLPITIELNEVHNGFAFEPSPVFYLNKRAIQHITQSLSEKTGARWSLDIQDRQLYLASFTDKEFSSELQRILNGLCDFSGARAITLSQVGERTSGGDVSIDINAYLIMAPQGDEALVTDYEHLLMALQTNPESPTILGMLDTLRQYLFENPQGFETEVDRELQAEEMTARLNYPSPIPLNFEQLAISRALRRPDCHRIVIEGPPGTGKSHTITALIFEALRRGNSVLLVSDKKEALDVVEDKINQVLNTVAVDESFQNPILRLGAKDNNFAKIFYEGNLSKIRARQRALAPREEAYDNEITEIRRHIAGQAEAAIDATIRLHSERAAEVYQFERECPELAGVLDASEYTARAEEELYSLWTATREFVSAYEPLRSLAAVAEPNSVSALEDLLASLSRALTEMQALVAENTPTRFLHDVDAGNLEFLATIPARAHALRRPIIGFLFSKHALESLAVECRQQFPRGVFDSWRAVIADTPAEVSRYVRALELEPSLRPLAVDPLRALREPSFVGMVRERISQLMKACGPLRLAVSQQPTTATAFGVNTDNLSELIGSRMSGLSRDSIDRLCWYWRTTAEFETSSKHLSGGDYLSQRSEVESRLTLQMSGLLDKAVLQFSEANKADAQALRSFIRGRKQIPKSLLGTLVQAFPCIIIGIRELGAYIPFEHELFDVVIIDEASQVSVAQALPAILRAKKAVVLGDPKQYSNVKAAFASSELNAAAFARVRQVFDVTLDAASADDRRLYSEKFANFNVKSSILDFVRSIANYNAFLRKHFRGYNELIHYSNETFYSNQLQVMKIRSRPLSEVILLHSVTADQPQDGDDRNVNIAEADYIVKRVEDLVEQGFQGTVGIITPFTDQQRYVLSRILESPKSRELRSELRLKVMTFDTCQGEERDLVLYSMVEGPGEKTLGYIFPASLDARSLDEEGSLRIQRLNVGLTRAKESVEFVVSKPLTDFNGAIGAALRFFELESRKPDFATLVAATDPHSPMEARVLQMISQTTLYRQAGDSLTIFPQFPIGEMLRQLDPYARVPRYKADFLITYRDDEQVLRKVIVEYDGAEYHFEDRDFLNEFTYDRLRASKDVERMRIIESYGYPIISLNKFLLRRHPVETIDRLLREALKKNEATGFFKERVAPLLAKYAPNEARQCAQCLTTRPIESFFDASLKTSVGKICSSCMPSRGLEAGTVYPGRNRPESEPVQRHNNFAPQWPELPDFAVLKREVAAAIHLLGENSLIEEIRDEVRTRIFGSGTPRPHILSAFNQLVAIAVRQARSLNLKHEAGTDHGPGASNDRAQPHSDGQQRKLIDRLRAANLRVVDNRSKGGRLWVIGDAGLAPFFNRLRADGIRFTYAKAGGRATHHRPGWFTSSRA
jgi:hypothetical protein